MAKTNSYQRAKARVKELEEQLKICNLTSNHYFEHLNISNNDIKDLISENTKLQERLEKSIKTTKVLILLSIHLAAIIIVLIATK